MRTTARCGRVSSSKTPFCNRLLSRERVGSKLEFHHLARRALAAFNVERCSCAVRRPHGLSLPARIWVVDASIHPLGVEAHGIGDAEGNELVINQGKQCLIGVTGGD